MKLDLKSLELGTNTVSLKIEPELLDSGIATLSGPGKAQLVIYYNKTDMSVEATVTAKVNLECSRCLKTFKYKVDSSFSFSAQEGVKKPGDEEDENLLFFAENDSELDIGALIAEEIAVNVPMKPVCKESCKGFCPSCGKDRKVATCGCEAPVMHPAWEALRKLKTE